MLLRIVHQKVLRQSRHQCRELPLTKSQAIESWSHAQHLHRADPILKR